MSLKKEEREEFERDMREGKYEVHSVKPHGVNIQTLVEELRNQEHRGDGSSTHYYELPEGATELRHLIHHKQMEHGIGEAFCALYRLNDNGEYLRNLQKAKFYIECAIEYYEKENVE